MAVLELNEVSEAFQHSDSDAHQRHLVVNSVSGGVKGGEFVAIVGARGLEKSTFLKIISGLGSRELSINLPQPRNVGSPELTMIKRQMLNEVEADFQFARRETRTEAVH
jgi:ABC-type lipoprotein export system ATPase subunit